MISVLFFPVKGPGKIFPGERGGGASSGGFSETAKGGDGGLLLFWCKNALFSAAVVSIIKWIMGIDSKLHDVLEVSAVIDLPAIFIANGIGVALMILLLISNRISARNVFFDEKLFFHMVVLALLLCAVEAGSFCLDGRTFPGARVLYLLLTCLLFLFGIAFTFLWTVYVDYKLFEDRRRLRGRYPLLALPAAAVSLLLLANLFTPVFFTISEDNVYSRTPMSALLYVVVGGYLIYSVVLVYHSRRKVKRYLFLPILLFLAPILLGIVLQLVFYGMSFIWVSVAVGLVSLYINIQNEASSVDSLTGLYNRQYLNRFLLCTPERQPSGQLLGGILLDVDSFKEINDTYGHMGGDAALRDVGGLLRGLPLPGGFAARYAGDEFILVQLVDSEEEITAVAQELRQRTEAFNRTHRRPYHLSFSMGCSLWRPGENLDTFLRHMDERMYAEKRAKSLPR